MAELAGGFLALMAFIYAQFLGLLIGSRPPG
jgi:hypothetical protein